VRNDALKDGGAAAAADLGPAHAPSRAHALLMLQRKT
jgi:hypothetical protein